MSSIGVLYTYTQWIYYSMRHVIGPRQHILATINRVFASYSNYQIGLLCAKFLMLLTQDVG